MASVPGKAHRAVGEALFGGMPAGLSLEAEGMDPGWSILEGFLEEGPSKLKNEEKDMGDDGKTDWWEKHEWVSEASQGALRELQPLGSAERMCSVVRGDIPEVRRPLSRAASARPKA